jgi:hypothetical protein
MQLPTSAADVALISTWNGISVTIPFSWLDAGAVTVDSLLRVSFDCADISGAMLQMYLYEDGEAASSSGDTARSVATATVARIYGEPFYFIQSLSFVGDFTDSASSWSVTTTPTLSAMLAIEPSAATLAPSMLLQLGSAFAITFQVASVCAGYGSTYAVDVIRSSPPSVSSSSSRASSIWMPAVMDQTFSPDVIMYSAIADVASDATTADFQLAVSLSDSSSAVIVTVAPFVVGAATPATEFEGEVQYTLLRAGPSAAFLATSTFNGELLFIATIPSGLLFPSLPMNGTLIAPSPDVSCGLTSATSLITVTVISEDASSRLAYSIDVRRQVDVPIVEEVDPTTALLQQQLWVTLQFTVSFQLDVSSYPPPAPSDSTPDPFRECLYDFASALGCSAKRFRLRSRHAGSIQADLEIAPALAWSDESSVTTVATSSSELSPQRIFQLLTRQMKSFPGSPLSRGKFTSTLDATILPTATYGCRDAEGTFRSLNGCAPRSDSSSGSSSSSVGLAVGLSVSLILTFFAAIVIGLYWLKQRPVRSTASSSSSDEIASQSAVAIQVPSEASGPSRYVQSTKSSMFDALGRGGLRLSYRVTILCVITLIALMPISSGALHFTLPKCIDTHTLDADDVAIFEDLTWTDAIPDAQTWINGGTGRKIPDSIVVYNSLEAQLENGTPFRNGMDPNYQATFSGTIGFNAWFTTTALNAATTKKTRKDGRYWVLSVGGGAGFACPWDATVGADLGDGDAFSWNAFVTTLVAQCYHFTITSFASVVCTAPNENSPQLGPLKTYLRQFVYPPNIFIESKHGGRMQILAENDATPVNTNSRSLARIILESTYWRLFDTQFRRWRFCPGATAAYQPPADQCHSFTHMSGLVGGKECFVSVMPDDFIMQQDSTASTPSNNALLHEYLHAPAPNAFSKYLCKLTTEAQLDYSTADADLLARTFDRLGNLGAVNLDDSKLSFPLCFDRQKQNTHGTIYVSADDKILGSLLQVFGIISGNVKNQGANLGLEFLRQKSKTAKAAWPEPSAASNALSKAITGLDIEAWRAAMAADQVKGFPHEVFKVAVKYGLNFPCPCKECKADDVTDVGSASSSSAVPTCAKGCADSRVYGLNPGGHFLMCTTTQPIEDTTDYAPELTKIFREVGLGSDKFITSQVVQNSIDGKKRKGGEQNFRYSEEDYVFKLASPTRTIKTDAIVGALIDPEKRVSWGGGLSPPDNEKSTAVADGDMS